MIKTLAMKTLDLIEIKVQSSTRTWLKLCNFQGNWTQFRTISSRLTESHTEKKRKFSMKIFYENKIFINSLIQCFIEYLRTKTAYY